MIYAIKEFYMNHQMIINILVSLIGIGMYLCNLIVYRDTKIKSLGFELIFAALMPYLNVAFLLLNGLALYINIISTNTIFMQYKLEKDKN